MMELSPSSSFCPGTFPPTTNFFLFNRTIPPVHINNLNNQTKPPVHINNLRVNQGYPVPTKRVGLIKKIQIQNKQPHLGAKQGIAPADYTIILSAIKTQHTPQAGFEYHPYQSEQLGIWLLLTFSAATLHQTLLRTAC